MSINSHTEDDKTGKDPEKITTEWANHCPSCGLLEERDYGPGRYPTADRCSNCNWPCNVVDPDIFERQEQ